MHACAVPFHHSPVSSRRVKGTKSAAVVLRTLVPAAAKIFRLLAEHQLADEDEAGAVGLACVLCHMPPCGPDLCSSSVLR